MKTLSSLVAIAVLGLAGAGCGRTAATTADEILVLTHYDAERTRAENPIAPAIAKAGSGEVTTAGAGTTRVKVRAEGDDLTFVVYDGGHDEIVSRLKNAEARPTAAVLVVDAVYSFSSAKHGEQLALAKAAGVPVVAAMLSNIDLIDDAELLDLEEMEIKEELEQAGYPDVPVIRASLKKAVEGDAAEQSAVARLLQATALRVD